MYVTGLQGDGSYSRWSKPPFSGDWCTPWPAASALHCRGVGCMPRGWLMNWLPPIFWWEELNPDWKPTPGIGGDTPTCEGVSCLTPPVISLFESTMNVPTKTCQQKSTIQWWNINSWCQPSYTLEKRKQKSRDLSW